jgi:type II secretory pathway pseudopilin PulG
MTRPNARPNAQAGFALTEAVVSALILCGVLVAVAAMFGATTAKAIATQRSRLAREWADTGMADIAARARRAPSNRLRTEAALVNPCAGCAGSADGTVTKTDPDGWSTWGEAEQSFVEGDGYVEFTPPQNAGGFTLAGPYGYRAIAIGWGGWMGIYENGVLAAETAFGAIPNHTPGDRYRIEWSGTTWKYYKIGNTTKSLIWTTSGAQQPGYPMNATIWLYSQGTQFQNILLHGVMSDPNSLPDGGSVTPGSLCAAPYCDYVWSPPRQGTTSPPPVALAPGAAPPVGSIILFVRRFKVETINPDWGLRQITMTLAETEGSQPLLTDQTRVAANASQ